MRRSDFWFRVACFTAVLLLAATLLYSRHLQGPATAGAGETPGLAATPTPASAKDLGPEFPVAVFVGDSFTGGSDQGGNTEQSAYWGHLSYTFGWNPVVMALGGTGYRHRTNKTLTRFGERVPAVISEKPSYVIFLGSRNDYGQPPAEVEAAAEKAYRKIHKAVSYTKIVAIGIPWVNAEPPPQIIALNDAVKTAAERAGVAFIDPIAEGWFTGRYSKLIGKDNVHPTDPGHKYMAGLIARDLRRLGIKPSAAASYDYSK